MASKRDDPEVVAERLTQLRDEAPAELQNYFLTFEDYWERKLWHELTDVLHEFFLHPDSGALRIPLYTGFVSTFADKLSQLRLVEIGLNAALQCKDDDERLTFLKELAKRVNEPASQDAFIYAQVAVARIKLIKGDKEGALKDLTQAESILETFDSLETIVHAAFYQVQSEYYQAQHEFASYYHTALLYLACIDIDVAMTPTEQQRRAYDLSIAALVSDSIYNFGELLLHPILNSLTSSTHAWLQNLLLAFNAGDLKAVDILSANLDKNELLRKHQDFLREKICLSALTEAVFRRPPHDRSMTFDTIKAETMVQIDQIEHLMMKALSLGLLKGTIDQVAQVANINWVQPKVLDMKQIENMRARLQEWDAGVNQLGTWIEKTGKDVWAA